MGRALRAARAARPLFVDVTFPAPRLIDLRRGGLRRRALPLARAAGWRPYVIDPRSPFATPERFPDAERGDRRLAGGGVRAARRDRPRDLDRGAHPRPQARRRGPEIALRSDARLRRRDGLAPRAGAAPRAAARGRHDEEELARRARRSGSTSARSTPEETALSIMAEVVAVRNGREGGRLRSAAGRIHEVGARDRAGSCSPPAPARRFGGAKQLAELDGRPLLEHAVARVARRRRRPRRGGARRARGRDPRARWTSHGAERRRATAGRRASRPRCAAALAAARRRRGGGGRRWATSRALPAEAIARRDRRARRGRRRGARDLRRAARAPVVLLERACSRALRDVTRRRRRAQPADRRRRARGRLRRPRRRRGRGHPRRARGLRAMQAR